MTPPFEVSAPVSAPAAAVRRLVDDGWVLRRWQRGVDLSGARVERGPGTLAVEGGWWYRGELSVEEGPDGARLVHRVRNVARRGGWTVPLANRFFAGYEAALQDGVDALARDVDAELGQRRR